MFSFLQSFTLRSILTITSIGAGIYGIHRVIAHYYDRGAGIGKYEWHEPPALVPIILLGLFIVGWPVYFSVSKWIDRRKKAAADSEKLRDFS